MAEASFQKPRRKPTVKEALQKIKKLKTEDLMEQIEKAKFHNRKSKGGQMQRTAEYYSSDQDHTSTSPSKQATAQAAPSKQKPPKVTRQLKHMRASETDKNFISQNRNLQSKITAIKEIQLYLRTLMSENAVKQRN